MWMSCESNSVWSVFSLRILTQARLASSLACLSAASVVELKKCTSTLPPIHNVFKHFLVLACHVPEPTDKPREIVFYIVFHYRLTAAVHKPVDLHDVRRDQAMADAVFCECVGYFCHVHPITSII